VRPRVTLGAAGVVAIGVGFWRVLPGVILLGAALVIFALGLAAARDVL
jgi:hypothetical protein